ncbi:nickel-dependent lactate racemase [Sphaerochaeta sp.]|jgi:nickel-dependent lactate racemase|uniref:nickel-dependent lactate racemase n=1 Tax=Sphaerochaeta sp. TaxID=1972642 RepID=UPI003D12AFEC
MLVHNPIDSQGKKLELPEHTTVYAMKAPKALSDPKQAVSEALANPIASDSFQSIAKAKLDANPQAKAVIVISDNTRPVPYKGEGNILVPLLEVLLETGYKKENLTVLIATGTHRPMTDDEIERIIDPWVFEHGIAIINHDCKEDDNLTYLGKTDRGSEVKINSLYMQADLKILTGLVESHFMAGVSGGRKSVCPGLISEHGTFLFHGADLMGHKNSCDLLLDGNPVHEESLAFAKMAGVDFIINVTLDHAFNITGVFAGDLEAAHQEAFEMVKGYAKIPIKEEADIVITHGGFVGINHYQSAKAAFAAIGAIKKDGYLISISNFTDKKDVVGSVMYKTVLSILALTSAEELVTLLHSKDWPFMPDQWQVQKWASVFEKIPLDHYYYYAPQIAGKNNSGLPGIDASALTQSTDYSEVIRKAIEQIEKREQRKDLKVLYLSDGPYAIPYVEQ